MKIKIHYFAQFADLAQKSGEEMEISDPSPEQLYALLKERYGFPHDYNKIQVAVNHTIAAVGFSLNDGDEVAFLPPMTGG